MRWTSQLKRRRGVLIGVIVVSALYLWSRADCDWIALDEGTLAHPAERVLQGEWPHRDFDDVYSGGQASYHALLFRLLGTDLFSLRVGLFAFSLGFVAASYAIAVRFCKPWLAGLVTLICLGWSVPNYFAGMPSWYNLFFATFSILAILKHMEGGRLQWLFVAGLLLGISSLFKITAVYAAAAVLLFLIYREQSMAAQGKRSGGKAYSVLVLAGLSCFVFALGMLVSRRPSAASIAHFWLPGFILAAALVINERKLYQRPRKGRLQNMLRMACPFLGGFLLPMILFAIPYAMSSSLDDLWQGIFIKPQVRFQRIQVDLPPLSTQALVLPLALVLAGGAWWKWRRTERVATVLCGLGLGLALVFGGRQAVYEDVWESVRAIIPVLVLVSCPVFIGRGTDSRQLLFLLIAMAAMVSMVQIPLSLAVYLCYAMPLAILAAAGLAMLRKSVPRRVLLVFMVFYLLYPVLWINRTYSFTLGLRRDTIENESPLGLAKAHLQVAPHWVEIYDALVAEVDKHSSRGDFIYATVDSPDVYFLCDRKNPTRSLFELFDDDFLEDPAGRVERIKQTIDEKKVKVVVLRWGGERYSGKIPSDLLEWLLAHFPHSAQMPYDYFTVLWRE
jgi:hypothetical protein